MPALAAKKLSVVWPSLLCTPIGGLLRIFLELFEILIDSAHVAHLLMHVHGKLEK
jgi:hypothetical protein